MARLLLFLLSSFLLSTSSSPLTRKLLSDPLSLKNSTTFSLKNSSKPLSSLKNSTFSLKNTTKPLSSLKNATKPLPSLKNSTFSLKNTTKPLSSLKNSTFSLKNTNPRKTTKNPSWLVDDPLEDPSSLKNSTFSLKNTTKPLSSLKNSTFSLKNTNPPREITKNPSWFLDDPLEDPETEESDLISEFRDLPGKFQNTLLPDLAKISSTSKSYLAKANKHLTRRVKPLVGQRYAAAVAATFFLLPVLLLLIILRHVSHHLSLQRIILFSHAYLSLYFSVLFLSSLITGLEPLRLFSSTYPRVFLGIQVLQAAGYTLFLMLQMAEMVVAPGKAAAALPKIAAAVGIGLHYYVAVFHRAVVGEPPRTSWKAHGVYAACFLSLLGMSAGRRQKKGDVGKMT